MQGRGVGTASPHLEGAKRPDLPGPDESGTGPLTEARRAEAPQGPPPMGGEKQQSKEYPTPEVSERPERRQFMAAYKLSLLQELDGCKEPGSVGRVLRREGIYSSLVSSWRVQRESGSLAGLTPQKRGRKPEPVNPLAARYASLERKNRALEKKLKRAEMLVEIQKKIADLFGISLEKPENEGEL